MAIFDQYTLSPGTVASFTEPTPELQRNYRTREMMGMIGKADEQGRWKYSLRDLVSIWISDRLSQRGRAMDRRDALILGYQAAPTVINLFMLSRGYADKWGVGALPPMFRYIGSVNDGAGEDGVVYGSASVTFNDFSEIADKAFDFALVVDQKNLAAALPREIRALLIAALENAD